MDLKDSDSDISDGWSLVDASTQSENESVREISDDSESVNCVSDGESLEIIQEENDERKEFIETVSDVENDCFSVISNCSSMLDDAVSDDIEWNISKSQTYVHHRNYLLNARLNFMVIVAVAAVTGLGVGHFIGSQEDCPSFPNSVPDVSVDTNDRTLHENPKLDSAAYFHESLISHTLKTKDIGQAQHNYKAFKNDFCAQQKQKNDKVLYLHQNSNNVKTCSGKQHEVCHEQNAEVSVSVKEIIPDEMKQSGRNQMDSNKSRQAVRNQKEVYLQDVGGNLSSLSVNTEREAQNITGDYSDSDTGLQQNERIASRHFLDKDRNSGHSQKVPDLNQKNIVSEHSKMTYDKSEHQRLGGSIPAKETIVQSRDFDQTSESGMLLKDAVDNMSGYKPSVNTKPPVSDVDDSDYIGIEVEETLLQDGDSSGDQLTVRYSDVISEADMQNSEQFPWLKIFSDTVQHLHSQRDSKLFSIIDLLASLKQSIVELDSIIISNESSKFLKKMKTSVSKMKETMEHIQKEASFWSAKTSEKIHHKLLKLKLKVQEKWCDVKEQYQYDDNIFKWLRNSLFQDCRPEGRVHHMKFTSAKMGLTELEGVNTMNKIHQDLKRNNEKKTYKNDFDSKRDSNKMRPKESLHKFKTNENKLDSRNYGYTRTAPDFPSHDFRKSSKGAFDKLRRHSTKCTPHCKREDMKKELVDPKEKWTLARKVAADWKESNNSSGIWMLRMAQGRADSRKNDQRSDWLFERARARKMRRDTDHERTNWYFERAQKRENCRLNPNSDWCLGIKNSVQEQNKYSYDHFDSDDDDDEDEEDDDDKQHEYFRPKFWSRKIPSAPFAKTGKWLKNSVKEFKQKMNYYQYNQHKFHYV